MRKLFTFMALALLIATTTSCGDDNEPKQPNRSTISRNLVNLVANKQNAQANAEITTGNYKFVIDKDAKTVQITATTRFSSRMPEITFVVNGATLVQNDDKEYSFTASVASPTSQDGTPYDGYTLSNIKGYINLTDSVTTLSYEVNSTYDVTATMPTIQSVQDEIGNDRSIYRFVIDPATRKADVHIYNIQFVPQMPRIGHISINGVDVTTTNNSYKLTCDSVVPYYYENGKPTPMETRKIYNFNSSLTPAQSSFSVIFDCYGITFSKPGMLYLYNHNYIY